MGMAVCAVVDGGHSGSIYFSWGNHGGFHFNNMQFSMKSEHIWFGYRSLRGLEFWSSGRFGEQNGSMKLSFGRFLRGKKLDVKKCGVRLVYEDHRDGECSFPNYDIMASVFLIARILSIVIC